MKKGQPIGKQFVPLTAAALGGLRILDFSTIRFILLLMEEYRAGGWTKNGYLMMPHRQIVRAGISSRLVARSIEKAVASGLVDAHRGGMRVATLYALTWLPRADTEPQNRPGKRRKAVRHRHQNKGKKQISAFTSVGRERRICLHK
jgi:hypothetical protein